MKILLLIDNLISEKQLKVMKEEVASLYKKNAAVDLIFLEEWKDYTNLPKESYDATTEGIKRSYITEATKEIFRRYSNELHHVVFLVHRDNWTMRGVWGWNLSKVYNGYGVQQCRFDSKNAANSIGTLYHELMHDHDTFVYTYTGGRVEKAAGVESWDDDVVHGGRYSGHDTPYEYIRYNENQDALVAIAPQLRLALDEKLKVHLKNTISLLEEIVRLQKLALVLKRQIEARQRGDIAIKPKNIC